MLTVIDLDAISKIKEIKKSREFSKLRKTSTIMLMGDNVNKNMVDNLKVSYDYFYRKDKKFVVKKREVIDNAKSLTAAIKVVKMHQGASDREVFVFGRNLDMLEDNSYQIFDLEDQFTDFYDSKNEIEAFVKKMIYQK